MQEILINRCYGGFGIPDEVRDAIFKLHPPHTELGSRFFRTSEYSNRLLSYKEDPNMGEYILVKKYGPYCDEYKLIKAWFVGPDYKNKITDVLVTRGDGILWKIDQAYYNDTQLWRSHPDVVRSCKELGWIGKEFVFSKLGIATIPEGYHYKLDYYDGIESVELVPPTAEVLHDLLDIIKNDDSIISQLPTEEVLQDLLERVKSRGSTLKNPLTRKLINGEITIDQFLKPVDSKKAGQ